MIVAIVALTRRGCSDTLAFVSRFYCAKVRSALDKCVFLLLFPSCCYSNDVSCCHDNVINRKQKFAWTTKARHTCRVPVSHQWSNHDLLISCSSLQNMSSPVNKRQMYHMEPCLAAKKQVQTFFMSRIYGRHAPEAYNLYFYLVRKKKIIISYTYKLPQCYIYLLLCQS